MRQFLTLLVAILVLVVAYLWVSGKWHTVLDHQPQPAKHHIAIPSTVPAPGANHLATEPAAAHDQAVTHEHYADDDPHNIPRDQHNIHAHPMMPAQAVPQPPRVPGKARIPSMHAKPSSD